MYFVECMICHKWVWSSNVVEDHIRHFVCSECLSNAFTSLFYIVTLYV